MKPTKLQEGEQARGGGSAVSEAGGRRAVALRAACRTLGRVLSAACMDTLRSAHSHSIQVRPHRRHGDGVSAAAAIAIAPAHPGACRQVEPSAAALVSSSQQALKCALAAMCVGPDEAAQREKSRRRSFPEGAEAEVAAVGGERRQTRCYRCAAGDLRSTHGHGTPVFRRRGEPGGSAREQGREPTRTWGAPDLATSSCAGRPVLLGSKNALHAPN